MSAQNCKIKMSFLFSPTLNIEDTLMAKNVIFGTDGVRGRANRTPMDSEMALQLGRAAAHVLKNGDHRHRIVIGKDTRLSGYMLETALASGITSAGTDVLLVGPLPTPGVAFIAKSMRADAGVVISGSHNDYRDNGIKFFDHNGFKLSDETEGKIEAAILSGKMEESRVSAEKLGKAFRIDDASGRYIQFLKNCFPREKSLEHVKIVVDCANGAAYHVAPNVLGELGATIYTLSDKPDGTNINLNCGSLHPEKMAQKVKEVGAVCGIALDGDADRVIMCDEKGHVLDGDVILALCALHWKQQGLLKKETLVATVMSNLALDHTMEKYGIRVIRTQVGDRYVLETMLKEGLNVGGEQSGHLIFLDQNTTGDGVLGAMQVLTIMLEQNKPLSELRKILEPYPQVLLNVNVREKKDFVQIPAIQKMIDDAKTVIGNKGRVFVRYSGTENIARVMVEGEDATKIKSLADNIRNAIQNNLGVLQ